MQCTAQWSNILKNVKSIWEDHFTPHISVDVICRTFHTSCFLSLVSLPHIDWANKRGRGTIWMVFIMLSINIFEGWKLTRFIPPYYFRLPVLYLTSDYQYCILIQITSIVPVMLGNWRKLDESRGCGSRVCTELLSSSSLDRIQTCLSRALLTADLRDRRSSHRLIECRDQPLSLNRSMGIDLLLRFEN